MSRPESESGAKSRPRARGARAAKAAPAEAPVAVPAPGPAVAAAPAALVLPASMTIREVDDLRAPLMRAVLGGALEIDATGLATIDTAGLQLLLAAFRSAAARGITPHWAQPSGVLASAAMRLGLAAQLGMREPA